MKLLKFLGVVALGAIFTGIIDEAFHVEFAKNVSHIAQLTHDMAWAMMGAVLYMVVSTKEKKEN